MQDHSRREVLRLASGLAASTVASSMLIFEAIAAAGKDGKLPVFLRRHSRPVFEANTATAL